MANGRRSALAPTSRRSDDTGRALRSLTLRQRQIELGRLNNTQDVALTADGIATTTVVTVPGVRSGSLCVWEAQNANAAAQRATTFAVCTKDTVTFNHAASALARSIRFAVFA